MIGKEPLNQQEKLLLLLGGGFLLFSFFYNLGIYPLYLEEPRRGLIALEMLINENLWVPTQTGDLYFRKPPVYNWVLIGSYKLFGEANELATRFFSVLSHILSAVLVFIMTKRYLNTHVALFSAFGFVLVVDILTYYSTLGEIDLFYALITSLSIFLIYVFGEKRQYWFLFLTFYFLTAVGFLTKGLTSLPFAAISLLVYFIMTKNFKKLLGLQHITGILFFLFLLFGYFYQYNQYQEVSGWWTTLLSESTDKATRGGFLAVLKQIFAFPLETAKNLLPVSLFIPLLFKRGCIQVLKKNQFVWFCILIFLFNYPIYWVSTEARSRYIYPLFPFIIIALTYLAVLINTKELRILLRGFALFCIALIFILAPGIQFVQHLEIIPNLTLLSVILGLAGTLFIWLWYKRMVRSYVLVLAFLVVAKFGISSIFSTSRQLTTGAAEDKTLGIELAEIVGDAPIYRLKDIRMSLGIVFYLERDTHSILMNTSDLGKGYYFVYPDDLAKYQAEYDLIRQLHYNGDPIWFIKVTKL